MAGKKASLFLKKENVQKLIENLRSRYDVFYPVRKAGTKWHTFSTRGTAELDYTLTINPPKKVFFPPFETMFGISDGKLVEETKTKTVDTTWAHWHGPAQTGVEKPVLLFGVHMHDVAALLILDKVFIGGGKFKDPYYAKRRRDSVIVALKNGEGPDAFQADYGVDWAALGARARGRSLGGWDLLLDEAADGYIATSGTKTGEKMLSANGKFFPEAGHGATPTKPIVQKPVNPLDLKKIAGAITPENPIWKDLAERCFGCGNCSFTCPICHCFEVDDRLEVTGKSMKGCRQRRWDSCYLPDFARVSGGTANAGHNFRPNLANRAFYWYHHKFVRAPLERGTVDCVGCGRCTTFCPAKIQIRDELDRLQTGRQRQGGKK